jgi:hypothetical protein
MKLARAGLRHGSDSPLGVADIISISGTREIVPYG